MTLQQIAELREVKYQAMKAIGGLYSAGHGTKAQRAAYRIADRNYKAAVMLWEFNNDEILNEVTEAKAKAKEDK
jgi:hypothetical protein